ncbi:hypothetical protein Pcinc_013925 [Petrolisthes cinctipes]|uniref:Uncharacterized protein n=1 Tax=Petrolisthes cinctipes TaxID=88211 RepID=A0AAE1FVV9_PETCI|nr:hypothetical protein Pcinc_013925 [Petrolisthes cinctipes]
MRRLCMGLGKVGKHWRLKEEVGVLGKSGQKSRRVGRWLGEGGMKMEILEDPFLPWHNQHPLLSYPTASTISHSCVPVPLPFTSTRPHTNSRKPSLVPLIPPQHTPPPLTRPRPRHSAAGSGHVKSAISYISTDIKLNVCSNKEKFETRGTIEE